MRVLTVNAGSSSLKLRVLDGDGGVAADRDLRQWEGETEPINEFLAAHAADAVGHRVVHGGDRIVAATALDDEVFRYLESLSPLAPLHQQRCLDGVRAMREAAPGLPAVACVDTAFHRTMPQAAVTYALPRKWNRKWSLRRYGFHGLSHSYAVRRGAEVAGLEPGRGRAVSCHLGAGCSLAAVLDGRCVDTTMGFTPAEGLVMATRSGSVDPGMLGWLVVGGEMDVSELFDGLQRQSGLAGLSGTSGDVREVLDARERGAADAVLAWEVYLHSLLRNVGAMIAVLGGLDLLVLTGGVGENQPGLRAELAQSLGFLGVSIDPERNAVARADGDVSGGRARVRTVVVSAREDLEIARQTREVLAR